MAPASHPSAPTAARPDTGRIPEAVVTPEEFGDDGYSLAVVRVARRMGPIFRWRLNDDYAPLFISSRELVSDVCDDTRYGKDLGAGLRFARDYIGDGLFTAYTEEENWAKAHDVLLPAFAVDAMRNYHVFMVRAARKLLDKWDDLAGATSVDVPGDLTKMTLDTIGLAGFGYDFDSFARTDPHPFVSAMNGALTYSRIRVNWAPGEEHPVETAQYVKDCATMAEIVDDVIDVRRSSSTSSSQDGRKDLLDLMLTSPYPATGERLDPVNVRYQVISFLIAGHETTAGLLSFALYYLMKNPEVLRRAQQEVDGLFGTDPDPEPTFADVRKLSYIRQILHESLRLWPTAPSFDRRPLRDTVLAGEYPVKAGETISVVTAMLHRDPVWGDNVELFDPDRFTRERVAARPPDAYKPFGTGQRACIGQQFALHEGTLMLALLVHRYRFLDHSDYVLDVRQTLTLKPANLTMLLARRSPADRAQPVAAKPTTAVAAAAAAPGTPVSVLHGSNLGAGVHYAEELANIFESLGYTVTVAPLDSAAGKLPAGIVLVVAASYNGHPTDDAKEFVRWLDAAGSTAAAGVRYAVLGLGDRNWAATYQRVPRQIDEGLAMAGATRLAALTEVDVAAGNTDVADRFAAAVAEPLLGGDGGAGKNGRPTASGLYSVTEVDRHSTRALQARHQVRPLTVSQAGSLVDRSHSPERAKRFVRLELPDGLAYRTADHFAVLPANSPALVERAAEAFGVDLDSTLSITTTRSARNAIPVDGPLSVRALLTHYVELQDVSSGKNIGLLSDACACPPEKAALVGLAETAQPAGSSLLELFERNRSLAGAVGWDLLLTVLPPMRLRHYSISSSPATAPSGIELMVSLLSAPHRSGTGSHSGVASTYLHGVQPGDEVLGKVSACRDSFRITCHEHTPVIMVAAGTGLAPFRGAIADRVALLAGGTRLEPAVCYFGCDDRRLDYLHADELAAAEAQGAVSMRPTFSLNPENGWTYVQDRIADEGDELWRLLTGGAKVYVCGDATRLAPGVRQAFKDLMIQQTLGSADDAEAWWKNLVADNRYVEDVFTSR